MNNEAIRWRGELEVPTSWSHPSSEFEIRSRTKIGDRLVHMTFRARKQKRLPSRHANFEIGALELSRDDRVVFCQKQRSRPMSKLPPVPPDNQSHIGPGDPKSGNAHQMRKGQSIPGNADEQGHTGNIKQNTTNQGYQQDR